jgi:hypothetical protein
MMRRDVSRYGVSVQFIHKSLIEPKAPTESYAPPPNSHTFPVLSIQAAGLSRAPGTPGLPGVLYNPTLLAVSMPATQVH